MTVDTLGARVARLRQQRGLSINQLARDSGVTLRTLFYLERDMRYDAIDGPCPYTTGPTPRTLEKLAQALGVPVEVLG